MQELFHVRYKESSGVIHHVRVRALSSFEAMSKVQNDHPGCTIVSITEGFD